MKKNILSIIIAILAVVGCFALDGAITMWLWNWVAVSLFNAAPIDFWLGCGITIVIYFAMFLFGNND